MNWSALAADAVRAVIAEGVEKSMTKFNRPRWKLTTKEERMRIYEELFIARPDATEEEIDHLIEQMSGVITNAGGRGQQSG